ncbi:hypothetical protein AO392_14505 [Pseudomonas putida]|uniref:hypothetical protein n=1 Tax=Pseudomonas TaxID=286 RepID=UPI0007305C24|nr:MULTISPECIES: hypothetical protein [Pseudomonas]KTC25435.1 hypothetical protein AO392_14505 [Pseudomonas putida]
MASKTIELRTNAERNYILVSAIIDWFEPSIIGGSDKTLPAARKAYVIYGDVATIEDEIEGRRFFRRREKAVVTAFLDKFSLQPGDPILVERLAPYTYRFMPG